MLLHQLIHYVKCGRGNLILLCSTALGAAHSTVMVGTVLSHGKSCCVLWTETLYQIYRCDNIDFMFH